MRKYAKDAWVLVLCIWMLWPWGLAVIDLTRYLLGMDFQTLIPWDFGRVVLAIAWPVAWCGVYALISVAAA